MRCLRTLLSVVVAAALPLAARAAEFPQRSVQIIVGAAPGGGTDLLSRLMAQKLAEKWGQPVVVVNKPGADHRVAAEFVAGSKPDGYTMFMMVNDIVLPDPPGVKVTYDPVKSFAPVALVAETPYCLAVQASFPANSLKELIDMARAQPGKLNFSANGTGSPAELGWQRLLVLTGTRMTFIHYQGGNPALTALVNGEVQINDNPCSNYLSHLKNGTLKVLAISQKIDVPPLSSAPTFEEGSGVKGYDGGGSAWYGLTAPAATPAAIVAKIRRDVVDILRSAEVKSYLLNQFIFPAADYNQDDFGPLIKSDVIRWNKWSKETESLAKKP